MRNYFSFPILYLGW